MGKKKGGKKGGKVMDGVATNEMTRDQLMGHVKRIQMELNREREERNFFMLEREKLYALWNLTIEQLSAAKNDTRMAQVQMDQAEKEREQEMTLYKQKVRYLMTQQWKRVSEIRLRNLESMKKAQQNLHSVELTMRETVTAKNGKIKNYQTSIHTLAAQLSIQNKEKESKLRKDYCEEIRRLESTFERLLFTHERTQGQLEEQELERMAKEKWNAIRNLISLHERQMKETKDYFREIGINNLGVISALQQELKELKERQEKKESEVEGWKRKWAAANREAKEKANDKTDLKDKQQLNMRRLELDKRLKKGRERYEKYLEVSNEILLEKRVKAEKERDELRKSLVFAVLEIQKKRSMKEMLLDVKLRGGEGVPGGGVGLNNGTTGRVEPNQDESSEEDETTQTPTSNL